jgi:glutathione-regulated potassium-efflux system protein KefB
LLEDLAIVPLLAVVAVLAPVRRPGSSGLMCCIGAGSLVGAVAAGRWLLNPMFRLLANAQAREVMTAAALLVVLGSALAMQLGGLSMAMGAFLAGVLLSESTFRHQLEADIEPFRGILLGMFFLAVGMSLDLKLIGQEWRVVALGVAAFMLVKAAGIFIVAKLFRTRTRNAITRVALFSQGGEFAFVLYSAAAAAGIFDARINAIASAIVILSMALTPLVVLAIDRFLPPEQESLDGVEHAEGLKGRILVVGFGRFGQVASQALLARGCSISLIETDVEMIQSRRDLRLQGLLRRRHPCRHPACLGRPSGRGDPGLRREARDGQRDRAGGAGRVPACEAVRARLRPRPCDGPDPRWRRLPDPRDLRIRHGLRR